MRLKKAPEPSLKATCCGFATIFLPLALVTPHINTQEARALTTLSSRQMEVSLPVSVPICQYLENLDHALSSAEA